jgi:hypothetical protein
MALGVDVIVFCDFCQFGRKIDFFLKNRCFDQIFAKTGSSLSKKRQYFRQVFPQKYVKNHNIGSWYSSV